MNTGKILTTEAAAILNTSPQFVRVAMQQGKLPIGIAIKMSTKWRYIDRKRGERMKLQTISLVISIIALVLAIAKAAG